MKNRSISLTSALIVGGNANNGANDGLSYANSNNVFTNANQNVGSRQYYYCNITLRYRIHQD